MSSDNKDLVWDLQTFKKRQRAKEFILRIETQLCVFSSTTHQLYTNYDIFFPEDEERKLVILPNPYSPHDTFSGLPTDTVKATGLFLAPAEGESAKDGKLQLIVPLKTGNKQYRKLPLQIGLNLINKKREKESPFLPVVMKGDLREFSQSTPCLHLHCLMADKMSGLSMMEVREIESVISSRMSRMVISGS